MTDDDVSGQQDAAPDPVTDHTGQEVSEPPEGSQGDSEPPPASSREASYRVRAREAESKLEVLQQRQTARDRNDFERLAAEKGMVDPSDLWRYDVDLAEFVDEQSGELNTEAVHLILAALADSKPHLFEQQNRRGPGFGQGNGHASVPNDSSSWSAVLSGN